MSNKDLFKNCKKSLDEIKVNDPTTRANQIKANQRKRIKEIVNRDLVYALLKGEPTDEQ